jgi:hypothetical protein
MSLTIIRADNICSILDHGQLVSLKMQPESRKVEFLDLPGRVCK